jgi:HTH-type transcriptional regulator / antitoxin HigA
MDIHPIKTEADYQAALEEIQSLFEAAPNTPQGDKLEVLATLVEAYEDKHFPIPAPDPIEAVRYFMDSRGLTRKDLEPYIGNRARVSEVLNRKRPLTLRMIQRLHNTLGVPADMLLKPYPMSRRRANKALPRSAQPRSAGARTSG